MTKVYNLAAIVIDKKDKNFGRIAKVTLHDWRESGNWYLKFSNGKSAIYLDKQEAKEKNEDFKIKVFYRIEDEEGEKADEKGWGPENFKKKYLELKVGTHWDFEAQVYSLFD